MESFSYIRSFFYLVLQKKIILILQMPKVKHNIIIHKFGTRYIHKFISLIENLRAIRTESYIWNIRKFLGFNGLCV